MNFCISGRLYGSILHRGPAALNIEVFSGGVPCERPAVVLQYHTNLNARAMMVDLRYSSSVEGETAWSSSLVFDQHRHRTQLLNNSSRTNLIYILILVFHARPSLAHVGILRHIALLPVSSLLFLPRHRRRRCCRCRFTTAGAAAISCAGVAGAASVAGAGATCY